MRTIGEIQEGLKRDDPEAHFSYGCFLAYCGHWQKAWEEMEWRLRGHKPSIDQLAIYGKPIWDGCNTKLLIYQDQGIGDLFQYSRYIKSICGCQIWLECAAEVYDLMTYNLTNHAKVVCRGTKLPVYKQVVPVCSLPRYFRSAPITVKPYLTAPIKSFHKGAFGIGIAWAGNKEHKSDTQRSCLPELMLSLRECGELVSLMPKKTIFPFMQYPLPDFTATANLINGLDCVVSVDTAVAHLAGAMGKPVYLMLAYEHDWRWQGKERTPWYPTMKLYRQNSPGDWVDVISRIKRDLNKQKSAIIVNDESHNS